MPFKFNPFTKKPDYYEEAPPSDIFEKFLDIFNWNSIDGWKSNILGTGSVTPNGVWIALMNNIVAVNDYTYVRSGDCYYGLLNTGKVFTIEWQIIYMENTAQEIWLVGSGSSTTPPSDTTAHFGFKIINGDLWASNADGTTQTITDTGVDLLSEWKRKRFKLVFTVGTDIKFYYNGVLKATHTTNLYPAGGGPYIIMGVKGTSAGDTKPLYLLRVLIEGEY